MPVGVKLRAALIALGLDPDTVDFHHDPPLELRPVNQETGDTDPPANDPRFIVPLSREAHKAVTFGDHRPLSGDISKIAKVKRVEEKQAAFRARLLAKDFGDTTVIEKKKKWPKRSFSSKRTF